VIVPPIGGSVSQLSLGQVEGLAHAGQSTPATGASGEAGGFGGELTEAISSLEKTQESASSASQALATGTVSDPESAVVTVENAQLAMELAAQIRTKATEAAQSIFNTQV
jgi:flagellar hook-basal body complex protein FliE